MSLDICFNPIQTWLLPSIGDSNSQILLIQIVCKQHDGIVCSVLLIAYKELWASDKASDAIITHVSDISTIQHNGCMCHDQQSKSMGWSAYKKRLTESADWAIGTDCQNTWSDSAVWWRVLSRFWQILKSSPRSRKSFHLSPCQKCSRHL